VINEVVYTIANNHLGKCCKVRARPRGDLAALLHNAHTKDCHLQICSSQGDMQGRVGTDPINRATQESRTTASRNGGPKGRSPSPAVCISELRVRSRKPRSLLPPQKIPCHSLHRLGLASPSITTPRQGKEVYSVMRSKLREEELGMPAILQA